MTSDNDDDNVVSDEFEHDANSIQNESYFLSVTLIQFLLMNSLLVTSMITWRKSIYNFNSL
jgi:DMSO/TMAO reductase YedYZ heme-binding membrane subunit